MENKNQPARCYNCKFFARRDSGFSNYTVEETSIMCLKKHFEALEESYSWRQNMDKPEDDSDFFKQAESCPDFKKEIGTQVSLDVEGETTIEDCKTDMEVYNAAKEYGL